MLEMKSTTWSTLQLMILLPSSEQAWDTEHSDLQERSTCCGREEGGGDTGASESSASKHEELRLCLLAGLSASEAGSGVT